MHLRDPSGFKDDFLAVLSEGLRREVSSRYPASSLFVEGIAQSFTVHLVRTFADQTTREYKGGLPGFTLRKVMDLMANQLDAEFSLIRLARAAV
jgi:AraC family transcriptional regulator